MLRGLGHDFIEGETIVVDVDDRPGRARRRRRAAGLRRRQHPRPCSSWAGVQGIVEMAFAVDDVAKARAAVFQNGLVSVG